jgi:hypothetical protein
MDRTAPGLSTGVLRDEQGRLKPGTAQLPRRRPGAPKGNLHGVRNPWAVYWRRRALRPEDRWALRLVEDYVPALVADKGGASEVSAALTRTAETAATARVCWTLALARNDLGAVARFLAVEQRALAQIGMERRARPVSLAESLRAALASASEEGQGETRPDDNEPTGGAQ